MATAKKKIAPPIDRPLSRAYLRAFSGWATAFPPGQSEPNSLREMENMLIDRNGAAGVRPGLRHLSYVTAPDLDPVTTGAAGTAVDTPLVGMQEPFYLSTGERALLIAVREGDDTVGFRAVVFSQATSAVFALDDPLIGFSFPQGEAAVRFTAATTHVQYLQINNRILAMSDAGEPIRMFFVGAEKIARRITEITTPDWEDSHKLSVYHPNAPWTLDQGTTVRRNEVLNPSFEIGGLYWRPSALCKVSSEGTTDKELKLESRPTRTNIAPSPLHDVGTTGTAGWFPDTRWGNPSLSVNVDYMQITNPGGSTTLFLAHSAKMIEAVHEFLKYRFAVDLELGSAVAPVMHVAFYGVNGAPLSLPITIDLPAVDGRYVSPALQAPAGSTSLQVSFGGRVESNVITHVRLKNLVVCPDGESTDIFHGDSGADYFWTGTANESASVYHPAVDVSVSCTPVGVLPGTALCASLYAYADEAHNFSLDLRTFDKDRVAVDTDTDIGALPTSPSIRASAGSSGIDSDAVIADMLMTVENMARGDAAYLDDALLEPGTSSAGTYFDGSTLATTTTLNSWNDLNSPHESRSQQNILAGPNNVPSVEAPTSDTLVASGGASSNEYKMGFFYTFENEVGESAPSPITEIRVARPWSNWIWELPNSVGEPSGTETTDADQCADQLICLIPESIYDQAMAEGAVEWNLYAFAWSDQEPVPVTGQLVKKRHLNQPVGMSYLDGGWQTVTPARTVSTQEAILPTEKNRANYTTPPAARAGLVAADRLILVGDPSSLATIRWSSNALTEYTNFTASQGGGAKTLTTGNLNIPGAVVLWQNPQSVDTLTILCMSTDGQSSSYYMAPANISAQQSGSLALMAFEETTSTPGTTSPYGAQVVNNALYRPLNGALLKSTASNYNINHKEMTNDIANMWADLRSKEWIMSAQLDNRLYFLVHNPRGELLEPDCKGNEIWVLDIGGEKTKMVWSRFLVQGLALRPFDVGNRTYMGLTKPEGLFYFDEDAVLDDYVDENGDVLQRPIPWSCKTNTQGSNRAHDAWAHLQQVGLTLGNFEGTMEWGVQGLSAHGKRVSASKITSDLRPVDDRRIPWDIEDMLQVRQDMKEWYFWARSVEGKPSSGLLGYVQYRYTPVTVNVGYEFGSVETFVYGDNVANGANEYAENGIPLTYVDYDRP